MDCWRCGAECEGDTCETCRDDGWQYPPDWKLERMEEEDERVSDSK